MAAYDEILDGFEMGLLHEVHPLTAAAVAGTAFGVGLKLGGLSSVRNKAASAYAPHAGHVITSVEKDPLDQAYLDTVSEALILIYDAFNEANNFLNKLDIQYHLPRNLPNLKDLSTKAPNNVNVTVQVRDHLIERRKPHIVRLRISRRTASATISISSLDPKLPLTPSKHVIRLDPRQRTFQLKSFQEQLIPALVDRARRAFRR